MNYNPMNLFERQVILLDARSFLPLIRGSGRKSKTDRTAAFAAVLSSTKGGSHMQEKLNPRYLVLTALFAAAIAATTAYILHIPLPTGGYIHVGDALIYLGACLLPMPLAMAAGAVGGMLADLLTAPMWAPATFVIKALICLPFTHQSERILGARNIAAVVVASLISPTLYGFVNVLFTQSWTAFGPQFLGTFLQGVGSGVVFFVLASASDKARVKKRVKCD